MEDDKKLNIRLFKLRDNTSLNVQEATTDRDCLIFDVWDFLFPILSYSIGIPDDIGNEINL